MQAPGTPGTFAYAPGHLWKLEEKERGVCCDSAVLPLSRRESSRGFSAHTWHARALCKRNQWEWKSKSFDVCLTRKAKLVWTPPFTQIGEKLWLCVSTGSGLSNAVTTPATSASETEGCEYSPGQAPVKTDMIRLCTERCQQKIHSVCCCHSNKTLACLESILHTDTLSVHLNISIAPGGALMCVSCRSRCLLYSMPSVNTLLIDHKDTSPITSLMQGSRPGGMVSACCTSVECEFDPQSPHTTQKQCAHL